MQQQTQNETPIELLRCMHAAFCNRTAWPADLLIAQAHARNVAEFGLENGLSDIETLLRIVGELVDVLLMSYSESETQSSTTELVLFCQTATESVSNELEGNGIAAETCPNLITVAYDNWGEFLSLGELQSGFDSWESDQSNSEPDDCHDSPPNSNGENQQIGLILESLCGTPDDDIATYSEQTHTASDSTGKAANATPFDDTNLSEPIQAPPPVAINVDQETVNAYADDAVQCVSVIETQVLRYEQDPNSLDALRQICRELHTIKGASAAIGLTQLAGFLHRVEDSLEQSCEAATQTDVEVVLQSVDAVRSQLEVLVTATDNADTQQCAGTGPSLAALDCSAAPDSIRVNAGQLDRLFDMLAELVMLRNRRDSNVDSLKRVNADLLHCVSRLRMIAEHSPQQVGVNDNRSGTIPVSSLTEIASDVLELGRVLRQTIDPITTENITLSRFIDQFRSEVIELRRLPVQSLFTRLQRPIRDAAKAEGKQVQVRFVNERVGLERSLHEKLYEPLMHVVRNAVSHGIESTTDRQSAGKPTSGTITIEAHSGSNLFVIEVRDDGKGLDYEFVRQRGVEKGLVSYDEELTNEEIANLIFRPGFSTRDEVSEISGRGVGMDVVASSVEKLHGWVELESKKGEGTCLRLLVPRSSFIESALVFRVAGQCYAFPTRFVVPFASSRPTERGIRLREVLSFSSKSPTSQVPICLESPDHPERDAITVWVDEVVGTEEVVTRPLPALMNTQRFFTGVTLSGTGSILLLLNAESLFGCEPSAAIEINTAIRDDAETSPPDVPVNDDNSLCIVVAEDSVTARLTLSRILREVCTCEILEAKDGSEALALYTANRDRVDLVITDIDMPRMTGFDLLRELQVLERTGPVAPVTVLSSRGDQRSRDTAVQFGAFHHLTKPTNESAIRQIIDRVLAGRENSESVSGEQA